MVRVKGWGRGGVNIKNHVIISLVVVRFGEKSPNLPKNEFLGLPLHKIPAVPWQFRNELGMSSLYTCTAGILCRGSPKNSFFGKFGLF